MIHIKKHHFLFFVLLIGLCLNAQNTSISDANFENYLETHDANGSNVALGDANSMGDGTNNNGLVLTNRINNVIALNVSDLEIFDLSGIEDFIALETLICSSNNLTQINVTNNTNLKTLLCGVNQISDLNTISNTNLEVLDCSGNQISTLNLANNILLERLTFSNNKLTTIDVSQLTNLNFLAASNNQLSDLDVSNNLSIESLFCASNQISALTLLNNALLKTIDVSSNSITDLDLSALNSVVCPDPQTDPVTICQGISSINVSKNNLTSLNIANGFNNLISTCNSEGNLDLFCIQIDNGFSLFSEWIKDDWTYYGDTTCSDIYTYIPDDNFEQALIDLAYDDVLDNLVLTSNISGVINLDVSNKTISSLTGIEDFAALQTLNCSFNTIESLDISNNVLTNLNASNNDIESINLNSNTDLLIIDVSNNVLTSLDISNNIGVSNLNCSNNDIQSLDLANLPVLTDFNCESNALQVLNLRNGQNTNLLNFTALLNLDLSCIETDTGIVPAGVTWSIDVTASYATNCGTYVPDNGFEQAIIDAGFDTGPLDNYVPTININSETNLDAIGYNISDLTGIEDFAALSVFDCSNNNIVELDLSTNTALTSINCSNNNLEILDLRNGTNNPQLVTFNVTNNPNLYCVNVDDVNYATNAAGWLEDAGLLYRTDCLNNRFTPIPGNNFEQALIDLGIDTGVPDNQVLTANIEYLTSLNVNGKNIENMEGIKAFKSLIELDCSNNYLNDLDVSNMLNLEVLYCSSNFFLTNNAASINNVLNTSGLNALKLLNCSANLLTDIDFLGFLNLEDLDCSDNKITTLNISNNTLLESINCSNNTLSNLDISSLSNLITLNCSANTINNLTTIGANNFTLINVNCSNNNLNNLLIDNYLALESLNFSINNISNISTNFNTALSTLNCSNNSIGSLDLNANINLIKLYASQNNLVSLDFINNGLLEYLEANYNDLTNIDLDAAIDLKYLYLSNNELSTLELSNKTSLIDIDVSFNSLSNIVLSNDLNQLKTINCSNNVLENDLDFSSLGTGACPSSDNFCPEFITINVANNVLDFINLQNGINTDITSFNASGNPNLYCIQVDDVSNIDVSWVKDATTTYSEDCRFGETYVPDDNFEQALINLGYDTGILDDYVPTLIIEALLDLDINGSNISDLTGIEDFIALQNLNCSNNKISTIDLSNNLALVVLNCSNNLLDAINFTENPSLINLDISNNLFSEFDTNLFSAIQVFNCDFNQLNELDFSSNTALTNLSCISNMLSVLNLQNGQNPSLVNLNVQNNSDLTCIQTDTGTEPEGVTWIKDATTQYAIDCHYGETYVPDDAFENALINLGYDMVLDDYVLTSNIENLPLLDVGGNTISDLTGIEDFERIITLLIDENDLTNLDLSDNVLIENLDASNNMITSISLSSNINLKAFNISNNVLTLLDVTANLKLENLNVSNNSLTVLDVNLLSDLEVLDCSSNLIEALDVSSNSKLVDLSCRSNNLTQDKLNLQNGANPNLKRFNTTNNPDLACILVDDPVTVISNTDGNYNDWYKDATANYQSVCDDADNDGVANTDDLCPATPLGEPVDLFGCPYSELSNDNFTILITGETCLNNNDGKINIKTKALYTYLANLSKEGFDKNYEFTNEINILNLLAGTYRLCITADELPSFSRCFNVVISHPENLDVISGRSSGGKKASFSMSGNTSFNVEFNGFNFTTNNSELTLNLENGLNSIKISTDLKCQGIHEETIFVSDDTFIYPNPFKNNINIYLGEASKGKTNINIYSYLGQLVYNRTISEQELKVFNVDSSKFSSGFYTVIIESGTSISTFKIVKK